VTLSRKRKRSNTTNDNDDDDDDGESDILTLGKALMQLLIDPDHSVRIHTAATITNLFTLMLPSEQVKCFQELYDILQSSSQIESKLDELSREDESVNRVASGLCLWLCVGSASGSCEHHVMSVLVSAAGRGRVDKCLIKKVIRNMSSMLGYTSDIVLLKNTLSYTIIHWLHDNGPIEEFPYQLFGVDNINQFLIKYHNMIVPYLVHHCLSDAFHKLSHLTSISPENLIISSLPMSLVFIITDHINTSGNSHRNPSHDNKSYQFISSLISTRDITQCMKDTLPQFIIDLLSRLYESVNADSCISQFFKSHDPLTTPPSYNSITIQQTLNFVAKNYFNEPAGNIIHVLIKKKDMIQTILLQLNLLVYGTHKLSDRKRFFMAYSLFVHLVSRELSTGLNGTAGYFILDVVHSVKRLLHHQSGNTADIDELFPLCCHTLRTVCEVAIDNCPELLAPHLHDIFNTLIPYTESHTTAVDLLGCIVQYGEIPVLRDVLVTLDPLPVTGTVSDVGNLLTRLKVTEGCVTLSKELLRFLSLDHHRPSVHGLMSLHKILKDNRYELYKLTQRQDDKGHNLVLQLMQALIDMVKGHGGGDGEVAIVTEVGKCLGEIGGMKMSLIAVPSARGVKVDGSCCATKIIKLLAKCLSDNDIDVVVASSQCIKSVLCTQNGCNALANIEQFDQSSSLWFKSLEPFKGSELNKDCNDVIIGQFESTIDVSLLWQQPSLDYPQGLKDLVLALLDSGSVTDEVVKLVKPVCQVKLQFCEDVFTLIIHDILKNESHPEYKIILSRQICQFISHAVSLPVVPIQYVNILLDVVMYLRSVPPNKMCSPWLGNFWLDLDFIDIARIALKCRSYFTSLLYIEIWYNHQLLSNNPVDVSECPHVKSLLLEVYRCIGEGDGYYGACVLYCPKEELTRRLNEHLQEWEELVIYGNWDATLHDTSYNPILAESYRRLGYFHLLSKYISNVDTSDDSNDEYMSYRSEMAWRCGIWKESKIELGTLSEDYHSNIQSLMAAVRDDNKTLFDTAMIKARSQVMDEILNINFESVCNISPHLTKLQGLLIFESVKDITDNNSLNSLLMDWREALSYTSDDFNINEFLLSLRVTVLHSLIQCYGDDQNKLTLLKPALVDMLMTISKLARRAKQYQIAKGSVIVLKHFTKIHSLPTWGTLLEEAKVYWYQGKGDIAMLLMKDLISTLQTMDCEVVCDVYPNALTIYGEWLMETLSENPQVILDEYLQKAVSLLQDQPSLKKDLQKAYLALARFHDGQYQRISNHMTSEAYMTKRDILTRSKNDITNLSTQKVTTPSTKRQLQQLSKYSNEDESLMKQQENNKTMHLLGAVKNYISCLMETDQFNLRIFRLCSLWFTSNDDDNVNTLIKEQLVCLPSYKLIPVVYQLAARLTTDNDAFQETLHQVLYTVCSDHPYHTLYVILALCNSGLDNEFPSKSYITGQRNKRNSRNKSTPRTTLYTVDQDKVDAACGLLEHLRSASKSLASLIKDISCLCDSLVDLAYHDSSAHRNKKDPVVPIPSTCQLFKYKFDKVHIPTLDLPVSPTADYDSSKVTIVKYDSTFSLCGGINLPKVVTVRGSDGRKRRQLLKSRDDLRQDAVMEQVFDVMNVLLMKDPSTASRKLNIRTYKV
jgi:ataxia telangiectasia mutated family protein